MSIPQPYVEWPPPSLIRTQQNTWADLYAGRTIGKKDVLNPNSDSTSTDPTVLAEERKVRTGIVADIANTSSSLIFGKGINLRVTEDQKTDDHLQSIVEASNLLMRLSEGGVKCSALGGVFWKAVGDPSLTSFPYAKPVDPTSVDPIFMDGWLVAMTTWTEVFVDGLTVYRWVENRDNRTRTIHGKLFRGSKTNLGEPVPASSLPQTAGFSEEPVSYPPSVTSLIWYVPNMLPDARFKDSPQGKADTQGAESLVVQLTAILSSLARDVRTTGTRVFVGEELLTPGSTAGSGRTYQQEREVYVTFDVDTSLPAAAPVLQQGQIRTGDHVDAALFLTEQIINIAGYSPQTFGLHLDGSAPSGTALKIREARSISTTEAKRRYWTPVIVDMAYNLLALSYDVFRSGVSPVRPVVEWPPVRDDDPLETAQTIGALIDAKAISIETAVRKANPDLDEAAVALEVARIQAENNAPSPMDRITAIADRLSGKDAVSGQQ